MKKSWLCLLTSILAIPFALADITETIKNAWWKVLSVGNLSFLGLSDGSVIVAFTRILIWIFLFTICFAGLVGLSKSNIFNFFSRGQSSLIAVIIATISAVFLPASVLLATGGVWATIIALVLIASPIMGLLWFLWNWPKEETCPTLFLKFLFSLLLFWILSAMGYHIHNLASNAIDQFINYALIIAIFLIIYYFIRLLFCGKGEPLPADVQERIERAVEKMKEKMKEKIEPVIEPYEEKEEPKKAIEKKTKKIIDKDKKKVVDFTSYLMAVIALIDAAMDNLSNPEKVKKLFTNAKRKMNKARDSTIMEDISKKTVYYNEAKKVRVIIQVLRKKMDKIKFNHDSLGALNVEISSTIEYVGKLARKIFKIKRSLTP